MYIFKLQSILAVLCSMRSQSVVNLKVGQINNQSVTLNFTLMCFTRASRKLNFKLSNLTLRPIIKKLNKIKRFQLGGLAAPFENAATAHA